MAQQYITDSGQVLVNPGTYVSVTVQSGASNAPTAGVLTIIGEANQGPDWTQEADLSQNAFDPTEFNAVLAKYGSGNIVDAFRAAVSAANDPAIVGAVSSINIVKTNKSTPAQGNVTRSGFNGYATLTALLRGMPGNLINFMSAVSQAEVAPSTGVIAYTPQYDATISFGLRTNGGSLLNAVVPVRTPGPTFTAALTDYVRGIMANGGEQYAPLTGLGGGSVGITAATVPNQPKQLLITIQAGSVMTPAPTQGDTLVIVDSDYGTSHASAIKGTGGVNNAGSYIVVASTNSVTSSTILVQKIDGPVGAAIGAASGTIATTTDDVLCFKAVTISNVTGQSRGATIGLSGTFTTVSNDGTNVVLQTPTSTSWTAQPQIGDTIVMAATFAGINAGFYEVTNSSSNTVSFSRMSDGSAGTTGTQNVVSPITLGTQPFLDEKPSIDGLGKSMEFVGNVEEILTNQATYTGDLLSNSLLVSADEYENSTTIAQGTTNNTYVSGGDIVLEVGCTQPNATMVVGHTQIAFLVGATTIFTTTYAQFPTMAQLAQYISSQSTFSANVPVAKFNNTPPSTLDEGTFGISSSSSENLPGRIKMDAVEWFTNLSGDGLVGPTMISFAGLPDPSFPPQFLSGGAKVGSSSADYTAAIDACERLDTNLMTPLVSQDASLDIIAGLTDPTSTYTVDGVNAYLEAHVIKMSALQMRKNRVAVGSKQAPYDACKEAAGQLSSFRFGLCFQPVMNVSTSGVIQTYQPWMAAIIAAGMQLAAGYKGIVKKFANISGFMDPVGFNSSDPGNTQDALLAGLMILEKVSTGGFRWVSDQLTYTVDNNFVYNSLQAVYLADLMTLDLIARFDRSVVGKSVAEISASTALSILASAMFDYLRLKWIAPSTDAVKGYKNASAKLTGGVMLIAVEIKLAGLIYFVPISMTISEVMQAAAA